MEFKGDIIITDPIYFSKSLNWGVEFNYLNKIIDSKYNFTKYIWEDSLKTKEGKWKISEINIHSEIELINFIENIEKAYSNFFEMPNLVNQEKLETLIKERDTIGRFCIDSGTFGIFYLNEVLSYNPKFFTTHGDWCFTIIKDFIGDIKTYEDSNGLFHIIGVGNKTFYSNTVTWL